MEVAINAPLDSEEIKTIIGQELKKILDGICFLQMAKEYASFSAVFNVAITLRRVGEVEGPKETLAWGGTERGLIHESLPDGQIEAKMVESHTFHSGDPNEERETRGMALTVETRDGRGNIVRKKVNVK